MFSCAKASKRTGNLSLAHPVRLAFAPAGIMSVGMAGSHNKLAPLLLVGIPLFGILAAAGWYAARAWISVGGPPMPATGYVAMTLGVVLSVGVGSGLMALLFYSNRHGYDEPYHPDQYQPDDHLPDDDHAQ